MPASVKLSRRDRARARSHAPNAVTAERLHRSLERLAQLIERVLLTERLGAGQVPVQPSDADLATIMDDALRAARAEAARKGIALRARYDPAVKVRLDTALTISGIQNLVDNAVKFTDEGSVSVDVEMTGDGIAIHVRDTCAGISAEELSTIFEPFQRGSSTKPGSGLGLAIAKQSVEAQGGNIGAASEREEGCHFWITLPVGRA